MNASVSASRLSRSSFSFGRYWVMRLQLSLLKPGREKRKKREANKCLIGNRSWGSSYYLCFEAVCRNCLCCVRRLVATVHCLDLG